MKKNIICKKVCFFVMTLMLMLLFAGRFSFSIEKAYAGDVTSRIVDDADVLTDEEEAKLRAKLDEISERQKFDVVINTINGGNYSSIVDYADDYFDYSRFSDSASKLNDGVVLVMDYGSRDFYISVRELKLLLMKSVKVCKKNSFHIFQRGMLIKALKPLQNFVIKLSVSMILKNL